MKSRICLITKPHRVQAVHFKTPLHPHTEMCSSQISIKLLPHSRTNLKSPKPTPTILVIQNQNHVSRRTQGKYRNTDSSQNPSLVLNPVMGHMEVSIWTKISLMGERLTLLDQIWVVETQGLRGIRWDLNLKLWITLGRILMQMILSILRRFLAGNRGRQGMGSQSPCPKRRATKDLVQSNKKTITHFTQTNSPNAHHVKWYPKGRTLTVSDTLITHSPTTKTNQL